MTAAQSKVVLVVDDDRQVQKLIADYLPNFGFTVAGAASRQALFEYLAAHTPGMIILDLNLPDGGGF